MALKYAMMTPKDEEMIVVRCSTKLLVSKYFSQCCKLTIIVEPSTAATLGKEESGHCRQVAVIGLCNILSLMLYYRM